jgi:hypothetical protein
MQRNFNPIMNQNKNLKKKCAKEKLQLSMYVPDLTQKAET